MARFDKIKSRASIKSSLTCFKAVDSTDVSDVVVINNNENEFIEKALSLKYKTIIFLTQNITYKRFKDDRIEIKFAYLAKNTSEINKARKNFDYVFAFAERQFFESKVDHIINAELSDKKDSFHYKNTSLNQVHAILCKQNNITITFNVGLLMSGIKKQQVVFGRMLQNALLVRKYKLKYSLFSFAESPEAMIDPILLRSLVPTLGLQIVKIKKQQI